LSDTPVSSPPITLKSHFGKTNTFGFITDTHLASKYARLDVLETAYNVFASRGVSTVLHAGNLVDGESKVNQHELLAHGIADQVKYALDHYPSRSGITTYYIDGDDHEGWWKQREGIEFGRMLQLEAQECGRQDLKYMGYLENDILLKCGMGQAVLKVMHPGGGSSYAYSYTSQKIVESLQSGEKPDVLLCGHYHKADFCYPRSVLCVEGGCTQDQTIFMRKKKLEAHVGFWVISLQQDSNGAISRFNPEWFPFYDRRYYAKRDGISFS
jgi:predicted phosphodiesterase